MAGEGAAVGTQALDPDDVGEIGLVAVAKASGGKKRRANGVSGCHSCFPATPRERTRSRKRSAAESRPASRLGKVRHRFGEGLFSFLCGHDSNIRSVLPALAQPS